MSATEPRTGWEQETIVSRPGHARLRQMVADGRARKDPTLAIALSVDLLGQLLDEVEAARRATEENVALREALRVVRAEADEWLAATGWFPKEWRAGRDAAIRHFVGQVDVLLATSTPSEESEAGT